MSAARAEPPAPASPRRPPPAGAIDCHAHVFGPLDRFPLARAASYDVPESPAPRYLAVLDALGLDGGVLVAPSAYGLDNGALLDALADHPERLRGVAAAGPNARLDELKALREAGVRGLRFAHLPANGPAYSGTVSYDALRALAPAMQELGLHAELWTTCELFARDRAGLRALDVALVLGHMGQPDPARGAADPAFRALLSALVEGRVWVKLTPYRMSARFPGCEDMRPFHEALLGARPDRLLWGSDWPHIRMTANVPDSSHLLDLCLEWTGDEELVRGVLVHNPRALYGFP